MDTFAVYRETHERIASLVGDVGAEQAEHRVPACPRWTVRDLLAHLAGVAADLVGSQVEGVGTESWTSGHVETRRDRTVGEILSGWDATLRSLSACLNALPGFLQARLIADTATHEQDLRGTLRCPGGRDSAAYAQMREAFLFTLKRRIRRAELPALRIRTEAGEWSAGEGEPAATVEAPDFEMVRALSGRRSLSQIAGFCWEGNAEPYIPLIPNFEPPAVDLVEPG